MLKREKDPRPFQFSIQECRKKGVVSGRDRRLVEIYARGGIETIGVISGVVKNLHADPGIDIPVCNSEAEVMFEISC